MSRACGKYWCGETGHHLPKYSFLHVTSSASHAFATACGKQRPYMMCLETAIGNRKPKRAAPGTGGDTHAHTTKDRQADREIDRQTREMQREREKEREACKIARVVTKWYGLQWVPGRPDTYFRPLHEYWNLESVPSRHGRSRRSTGRARISCPGWERRDISLSPYLAPWCLPQLWNNLAWHPEQASDRRQAPSDMCNCLLYFSRDPMYTSDTHV